MAREEEIKQLKKLYPTLTDKECEQAAENLRQYMLLVWEISEGKKGEDQSGDADST